jgi:hypothetical protein
MAVIVPTRGRRHNVERLARAWLQTRTQADLFFAVDEDDADTYDGVLIPTSTQIWVTERTSMCGALNHWATQLSSFYPIIGFMGDDHLPRTMLWDQVIRATLSRPPGIAYGNDLMQGVLLPTAVFMTSDVIDTLGYMAPPCLTHLHLDTVWKRWGEEIGRLHYLPEVIIEHMHPQAGKAEWDDGWRRVNSAEQWSKDDAAYGIYVAEDLQNDIAKLRKLC